MKIFFVGSVKDRTEDLKVNERYEAIVEKLKDLGHKVEADHILNVNIPMEGGLPDEERLTYYKEILEGINKSDLVIAEISNPTASVGHQVTIALEKNKPVLAITISGVAEIFKILQSGNNMSFLEADSLEQVLDRLDDEIAYVKEGEDIRFNFLIPPSMVDYLEWVSKHRRIPKSVFLRDLVTREMESDTDYHSR